MNLKWPGFLFLKSKVVAIASQQNRKKDIFFFSCTQYHQPTSLSLFLTSNWVFGWFTIVHALIGIPTREYNVELSIGERVHIN